jgi:hypothetical protein
MISELRSRQTFMLAVLSFNVGACVGASVGTAVVLLPATALVGESVGESVEEKPQAPAPLLTLVSQHNII